MFNIKIKLFFLIASLFLLNSTLKADEIVDLGELSQEELEEIFLVPADCKGKDKYGQVSSHFVLESVNKSGATGKFTNARCPGGWGKTKLTFKGKKYHYKSWGAPNCVPAQGEYSIYKAADGSHYAKGKFSYNYQGAVITGTEKCVEAK